MLETDTFHYFVPASEPAAGWMQLSFDDSSRDKGIGGFGYSDEDDNTLVAATTSIYFRRILNGPPSVALSRLLLDIDYDDTVIAYVYGIEAARSANLLAGTPAMDGSVTFDNEAVMYSGGSPERFFLDSTALVEGEIYNSLN